MPRYAIVINVPDDQQQNFETAVGAQNDFDPLDPRPFAVKLHDIFVRRLRKDWIDYEVGRVAGAAGDQRRRELEIIPIERP